MWLRSQLLGCYLAKALALSRVFPHTIAYDD